MYLGVDRGSSRITQSLRLDARSSFSKEDVTIGISASSVALPHSPSLMTRTAEWHSIEAKNSLTNYWFGIHNCRSRLVNVVEPDKITEVLFHSPG